jgi:hypothetical protein
VYYWQGENITFSESGLMLLDKEKPENEQMVFANAFAKFYRNNPFKKVLNDNTPLVLLLQTIQYLNQDKDFNGTGISRKELPILLCWRDGDAHALYLEIKKLRKKYSYTPSNEVVLDICENLIDEIKRDDDSILNDYPDDFIRKMRLTGLITVRGGGRFIDINSKEQATIEYILQNYKTHPAHTSGKDFFDYIGKIDHDLISKLSIYQNPVRTTNKELDKWVQYFDWATLKSELQLLAKKGSSKNDVLRIIENALRLEFLTALAILKKMPLVEVKPNFIADDEGLPVSFASGGNPDIECKEKENTILVEVTLLTGTQQHIKESFSILRHLKEFIERGEKAYTIFISPKSFVDTCEHSSFVKFKHNFDIRILDIELFTQQ